MKASCLPPGVTVVANIADACEAFSSLVDRPAVNPGALKLKMRACLAVLAASCVPVFPAAAQQVTGSARFTQRHVDDRRPVAAGGAAAIRRDHQPRRPGIDALVAAHRGPAEGRAERAADHHRRRRLRRLRHLRRRHPDADARPDGGRRAALHPVPLHRALLADPRRADHRAQPPFVGLRGDRRASHRLSGLRFDHRPGQRHDRQHPEGPRLRHLVVRQEPQHPHLRLFDVGPVRSVALGHGLRLFLRLHGRRIQPVDALAVPRPHPDLPVERKARLQPDHRHGRRRHQLPARGRRRDAGEALLPLLRAGRHPRAAPSDRGMDQEVRGQVRHGLERHARRDLRQPEAARRDPGEHPADPLAG